MISGLPTNAEAGTYALLLSATDEEGTAATSFSLEVRENLPAKVTTTPSDDQVIGFYYYSKDFSSLFSDHEGDTLTVALFSSVTSFLSWNDTSKILSGTPTNEHKGTYTITLTASQQHDDVADATISYVLTVKENHLPSATEISAMTVKAGTSVLLDASENFSEPESEPIIYSLGSDPDTSGWLSIDSSNGKINSPVTNS